MKSHSKFKQSGLTIIELMIGITILGVLASIALPSYQTFMLNTQIRTAAESILNGLQLARAEAVKRNTNVRFALTNASGWTVGCVTPVNDLNGDGVPDCPAIIQERLGTDGSRNVISANLPLAATTVTYNSFGAVGANAGGAAILSEVTLSVPTGSNRRFRVVLTGGSVRMCDPDRAPGSHITAC